MYKQKIIVLGHARHGKDTACEYLKHKYKYNFVSSSMYCAEFLIYPKMPQYATVDDCFNDRQNNRKFWYDTISSYNKDKAKLGREILSKYDIYCGLRNADELRAIKSEGIVDLVIWIDASKRQEKEDSSSCTVQPELADIIIDNNGSLSDLYRNLDNLMLSLERPKNTV